MGWRGCARAALALVALALVLRVFVVQAFRVPSRAMEDTLLAGDYLLVEKVSYGAALPFTSWRLPGLSRPARGDVVVFHCPPEPERVYAKRCVAVGGQVVEVRNKVIYVDGERILDPPFSKYVDARIIPGPENPRDNCGPVPVPEGSIFVVGDNRDNSRDSRHWGVVSQAALVGRAAVLYWSCEPLGADDPGASPSLLRRVLSLPGRVRWGRVGEWVE
ncbi:MAG: signal peptidase I [Candidatus Latescibacterota bacterium]